MNISIRWLYVYWFPPQFSGWSISGGRWYVTLELGRLFIDLGDSL